MNKLQKSKKEDFALEESARSQKAKYDEASDDVQRRMLDIKEAEVDSINDLSAFLDAELAYYDRAREVLMQLKRDWPACVPAILLIFVCADGQQNPLGRWPGHSWRA